MALHDLVHITPLTSFSTSLPIVHTTLCWPPCCLNTAPHASVSGLWSCYCTCLKHTSPRQPSGSWLTPSLPSGLCLHVTVLGDHPSKTATPNSIPAPPILFPCYVFLHSNYHLLTSYTFYLFILFIVCFLSVDLRSINEGTLVSLFTAVFPAPRTVLGKQVLNKYLLND